MNEPTRSHRDRLTLRRFATGNAFLARATPFLLRHEAAHNLLLGIAAALGTRAGLEHRASYLATVERDGAVVAAALMTPPHSPILSLTEEPGAATMLARDLAERYPDLPGVLAPKAVGRDLAQRWQELTGRAHRLAMAQRIYQLDAVAPVRGVPGELRPATAADRDLLLAWAAAFAVEAEGEPDPRHAAELIASRLGATNAGLALWRDGQPVALAGYGGATPNGIRIGPVYTPPEFRGRGYASAATAEVSRRGREAGAEEVLLYTDLANPTSNSIYQRIGYQPVEDRVVLAFSAH